MASIRKRTWTTKTSEKSAWIVAYLHNGKQHIKTFATKREASEWRATMTLERQKGVHTPASTSITVAEAGERWLRQAEIDGLEGSTLLQYREHLKLHILPHLANVKLTQLTPAGVQDFRNTLSCGEDRRRSPATVQKIMVSLGSILAQAMSEGLGSRNPVREAAQYGRRRGKLAGRHRQHLEVGVDIPSKANLAAILAHAPARWRPLLMTAVYTGLRASELRGLTWHDVDLKRASLTVRQRADRWNAMGSPKSATSKREIPLARDLVTVLREWRLACPKGPLGLCFPDDDGAVVSTVTLHRHALGQAQVNAGICKIASQPRYSMHSLRHACASLLIEAGQFSPKEIQAIMGHAKITMTYDTYGHLMSAPEASQQKIDGLTALLG
jgi:integrase